MDKLSIWAVPVGSFVELRAAKAAPIRNETSKTVKFKNDWGETYQMTLRNVAYTGGKTLLTISAAKYRVFLKNLGITYESLSDAAFRLPAAAAAQVKDPDFRRQYAPLS